MDMAKVVAVLLTHGGDVRDYYGEFAVPGPGHAADRGADHVRHRIGSDAGRGRRRRGARRQGRHRQPASDPADRDLRSRADSHLPAGPDRLLRRGRADACGRGVHDAGAAESSDADRAARVRRQEHVVRSFRQAGGHQHLPVSASAPIGDGSDMEAREGADACRARGRLRVRDRRHRRGARAAISGRQPDAHRARARRRDAAAVSSCSSIAPSASDALCRAGARWSGSPKARPTTMLAGLHRAVADLLAKIENPARRSRRWACAPTSRITSRRMR